MLMFDSLNRNYLPPYGNDWVHAPNFQRLAKHSVTFTNSYVGSMPCMPARRELHTGRYNFLHRSWGPLEPFDESMPFKLSQHGIHTHLETDHWHYFSPGGGTYHTRYDSWMFHRGQMADRWIGQLEDPDIPEGNPAAKPPDAWRQQWVNRENMPDEQDHYLARTVGGGIDFIRRNRDFDDWFCQIECFDPHEPFFSPQRYKELYSDAYEGPVFDCPTYSRVTQDDVTVRHMQIEYAALVSMCDAYLGQVLDVMDELDLWDDTMLIVNTDHGFLLGEHDWWGKMQMPWYQELANTPLFIWDPRHKRQGVECNSLVQTIDLPATLLEYFEVDPLNHMEGIALSGALASDSLVHDAVLFGRHGWHINCTDGRYVLMLAPNKTEHYEYTLMPTHMWSMFSESELASATLSSPFDFTNGAPLLRMTPDPVEAKRSLAHDTDTDVLNTVLYDLDKDARQVNPIKDSIVESVMRGHAKRLMKANDAPSEVFSRYGL